MERAKGLARIIGLLVLLQGARYLLKQGVFLLTPAAHLTDRLASAGAMLLLTAGLILLAARRGQELAVFPARFGPAYIGAGALFAALLVSTALFFDQGGWSGLFLLIYGALITPLYEELLFRGLIWQQLAGLFPRTWQVWAIDALLFGLWHLGYADSLAMRAEPGALAPILAWKVATGLAYGLVLGLLRCKTKNCFSTMLLHGALNMLAG